MPDIPSRCLSQALTRAGSSPTERRMVMDFRNPPGQYDPDVHKKRHDEKVNQGAGRGFLWNLVNLLIGLAIVAVIILLVWLF